MADKSGLEKLDFGALSIAQQQKLRQFKINTRINNEKYLREHPETEVLISDFLRDVFLKRPTDIREYAADYFTNPNLCLIIGSKLQGDPADTGTD
ncbi:RIIa domain-containing protein 1-like [Salvelinus namaycush]|uniref:RIIa domain-containing protein 1-like n=1 Tax=Salvelinus namaycush TaxID=8040 RepID=A0A8U0PYW6_SALNM|nr:RIIa domain-containing protein 1-like [Salvelinus namaycush]